MSKQRKPWLRATITLLITLFCLVLLYQTWLFTQVIWYSYVNPTESAVMRETLSMMRERDAKAQLQHTWVSYAQINNTLKRAVVSSEDANFTEHDGVEWAAIREALEYNQRQEARGKTKRRGGSTITQQLAKNLFLSNERNYLRKGQELVLTYMIELVMSKQRILELYLNVAEWGKGVFGAQAAAKHYFNTTASQLNTRDAARLAAMLPNPRYYDQNRDSRYLNTRVDILVRRMPMVDIP